jgi:hypothetical protein
MRSRQAGITFIGWLLLLAPLAVVGYAGLRLAPLYLNYMKVARALQQTATENKGDTQLNVAAVKVSLSKRFDVNSIDYPTVNAVTITREGKGWVLAADYEDTVPLFAGVSLLVHFDKRAVVD